MRNRKASSKNQTMIIAVVAVIIIAAAAYFLFKPAPEPTPQENSPPIVVAISKKSFTIIGSEIELTAEGSKDTDGSIATINWNLGDGSTNEGMTIGHTYSLPGDYITIVTTIDNDGASTTNDVSPIFIKVDRVPFSPTLDSSPISLIAVSNQIEDEGEQITFDGASSYGWKEKRGEIIPDTTKIVDWTWDFGDGITEKGMNANHTYSQSGNYCVKLTAIDEAGQTDTVARTIRILPEGQEYEGTIKNPETFVYAADMNIPSTLDLWRTQGYAARPILLVLSDMLTFTGKGDIEPQAKGSLSQSWEISDDGKTYIFHLREGVKFWNGDELLAEDIEYSFERVIALSVGRGTWDLAYERLIGIGPGNPVPEENIKNSIEVSDDYTVVFNFVEPYAPFLTWLAYPEQKLIVQKNYAIDNGAWNWDDPRDFTALAGVDKPMEDGIALMCTGPFSVKDWSKGDRIVLERFDDYWQGPAQIKYVRFISVMEWSTRNLMLKAGDADGINIHAPDEFEQMLGIPGIKTIQDKYAGFLEIMYFGLDLEPSVMPPENQVPSDFFNDVHMRRAFAYAFPYEKYIEEIWLGYAEAAKSVQPEGWQGYYPNFPYYYDLEKAEEELKLAHGGKYWEEGFQVAAGCQTWATKTHGRAYELLSAEFAKIDPKFKVVTVGTKWSDMLEMPLGMLVGVITLDPMWYRLYYHSVHGFEASYGWKNELVDELLVSSTTTPFMEDREVLISQAMDIVADECPAILSLYNPHFIALQDYIDGYYYQVNHVSDPGYFYTLEKGN